ncbi:MAG: hypothetical protein IJW50_02650 [Clostridia bacterium]|nr:hypothetical protein [Clostridia bacterium]
MEIVAVQTKKEIKQFKEFRKKLYANDPYYVSTAEFTLDMLLNKETAFAKRAEIRPIMGIDCGRVILTALLIHNPKDDFLQIAFFEALENIKAEVFCFLDYAKEFAKGLNLKKIIIGLNGHLSYGVGISLDMKSRNTFDSTYTKLYYADYFEGYKKHDLVAFSNTPSTVLEKLPCRESSIKIRKIDLKKFEEEMELFRTICDETIGTTFLYSKTEQHHFYDLLKDMTFFLRSENLLFAEDDGHVVGFVFWHPDYNEVLKSGRQNSLLEIAVRYLLRKNKIKKVKLNAIGVKKEYQGIATLQLLNEVGKYVGKYDVIETNFVWCNNKKSMALNDALLQNVERRFAVYEVNV